MSDDRIPGNAAEAPAPPARRRCESSCRTQFGSHVLRSSLGNQEEEKQIEDDTDGAEFSARQTEGAQAPEIAHSRQYREPNDDIKP